ncbi:MAG TPA: response regulator [Chloroflexota bacterium]|nr:response regulator [Chloroflexota bacterium]
MATILVADDQADIRELLEITLSKRGHEVLPADSGTRALELAGRVVPDLAIVDVNMPGLEGTQVTRELRTRKATANVPIMLLTALSDEADILAGFAAGADDYVTKPFNPRELAARVEALLARGGSGSAPSSRPQGRLIAVAGPKGGCGRTTIAVNLALAMVEGHSSGAGRSDVLLLDANFGLGDLDVHLDLRTRASIRDLVPYTGHVDVAAFQNALAQHRSGVRVLLRPEAAGESELISTGLWQEVLHIASAIADTVIVDLGPTYDDERTLATLEAAEVVVLVSTPEIGSVRNARQFLDLAPRLGVQRARTRVVLNRAHDDARLSVSDVARALGLKRGALACLPEAGAVLVRHLNSGTPIVRAEPGSALARALEELAAALGTRASVGAGTRR